MKDKEIEILKLKYNTNKIEMMDYLMLISEYVQDFDLDLIIINTVYYF